MLASQFCYQMILVFDKRSPVHLISEFRGGTVNLTDGQSRRIEGNFCFLYWMHTLPCIYIVCIPSQPPGWCPTCSYLFRDSSATVQKQTMAAVAVQPVS